MFEDLNQLNITVQALNKQVQCLLSVSPAAPEWTEAHQYVFGNNYVVGQLVWYDGYIYKCIYDNDSASVSNSFFWQKAMTGYQLPQEQSDWFAKGGKAYIRNKPTKLSDFINDIYPGQGYKEQDPQFNAWLETEPYVPSIRTITINGNEQDLSANRVWNVKSRAEWGNIIGDINAQTDLIVELNKKEDKSNKGIPDGYASLDATGKVPASQLPPLNAVFTADIPVVLSGNKTLGKYVSGQTIRAIGKTAQEVITDIALEYVNPAFTSFNISSQPTTVEVGTSLSGGKIFSWSILPNSGTVGTIDIYDVTFNTTLLAGTPNDGTQAQNITSVQLNFTGASQTWKGIANNSTGPNVSSGNFVVTAYYNRYWGPTGTLISNPSNGAANRTYAQGLGSVDFKTPGANNFTLVTGTTFVNFVVILPPGVTITKVIDLGNLNADLTKDYILSTITLNDIGGTPRTYNQYVLTLGAPYSVSTNHSITTS